MSSYKALAIDVDHYWKFHKIISKEDINGMWHYLVDWSPTLELEHSLLKEVVDKFEAQL